MNTGLLAVLIGSPTSRRVSDRRGRGDLGRRYVRRRWLFRLFVLLLLLAGWVAFVEGFGTLP